MKNNSKEISRLEIVEVMFLKEIMLIDEEMKENNIRPNKRNEHRGQNNSLDK